MFFRNKDVMIMNLSLDSLNGDDFNHSGSELAGGSCRRYVENEDILYQINSRTVSTAYTPTIVYVSVLLFLGIPGNALVFYVYHSWRRSPSRLVILALAVFDLVNCLFTIPTEIYFVYNIYVDPNPVLCKITRFITFSMNNASSFVLLFIAVDRFKRIYKPLKPPYSNRVTKIVIGVGFVLAFLFSWPSIILFGSYTLPIPLVNGTCLTAKTCLIDDQYKFTVYPLLFNIILTAGNIAIDLIMIGAYAYIGSRSIKAIRETHKFFPRFAFTTNESMDFSVEYSQDVHDPILVNREKNVQDSKKHSAVTLSNGIPSKFNSLDRKGSTATIISTRKPHSVKSSVNKAERKGRKQMLKSTFMLFLVTVLFIASFIPYCTIVFIRYTRPNYYTDLSAAGKAVYNVLLRSYMLSSALNPLIYSFLSSKFRKQCYKIGRKIFCFGQ
ncbi:cholecystokinin receptor type A-like isoform X1 [Crassostrea virginica]